MYKSELTVSYSESGVVGPRSRRGAEGSSRPRTWLRRRTNRTVRVGLESNGRQATRKRSIARPQRSESIARWGKSSAESAGENHRYTSTCLLIGDQCEPQSKRAGGGRRDATSSRRLERPS